jgi:hypothetical protein
MHNHAPAWSIDHRQARTLMRGLRPSAGHGPIRTRRQSGGAQATPDVHDGPGTPSFAASDGAPLNAVTTCAWARRFRHASRVRERTRARYNKSDIKRRIAIVAARSNLDALGQCVRFWRVLMTRLAPASNGQNNWPAQELARAQILHRSAPAVRDTQNESARLARTKRYPLRHCS